MPIFEHGTIKIEVDEDGFMQEPDVWNQEVAAALATTEGVSELSEEHWKIVNYLRDYYQQFGIAPMIRKLCKETGFPLKKIYELFPSGPAKGACKIAVSLVGHLVFVQAVVAVSLLIQRPGRIGGREGGRGYIGVCFGEQNSERDETNVHGDGLALIREGSGTRTSEADFKLRSPC